MIFIKKIVAKLIYVFKFRQPTEINKLFTFKKNLLTDL